MSDSTPRKHIWIEPADPADAHAAREAGATALVLPEGADTAGLPRVGSDGDLQEGRDFDRYRIKRESDEEAVRHNRLAVVEPAEWTIIPAENLIARGAKVVQVVDTAEQAKLALTIMEQGVAGIWLRNADRPAIEALGRVLDELQPAPLSLTEARITAITPVGMGDRSCLDLIGELDPGEGLLVGSFNHARFLVHSENVDNPHCAARPFRVNAGAIHGYVVTPGDRVRYLAEMASGDPALVVGADGKTRALAVGRNKIERRPMVQIEAVDDEANVFSAILQHAETIRLVNPEGKAVSVLDLNPGDRVRVSLTERGGRHFGRRVEETILER
ncbi:3-dehydroquinate synthase II [Guyparkeria hydrothermalis]|uniref:3-dehydroquinate synthase II n=1 Tax=Guyparkeria hydrothermalis TaxID=923 RepID=UPI002022111D|nr:3-dehydroquinate synthase II [Guyparkeria hydrothermalis]MCL7744801.1 3-dehydroquinate synthase II [Guyparkeria hydrothermalis]